MVVMTKNAFKPGPSALRSLRHHPRPQSCRPQVPKLFSTSPEVSRISDSEQKRAESKMLDMFKKQPSSPPPATPSPARTLAEKTGGSPEERVTKLMQNVRRNINSETYMDESPPHHLHVYAHKRSTLITLTRPNREVMLTKSCGSLGLKHARRKGYDPAHQLSSRVLAEIQERGWLSEMNSLELIYRDFGPGREAFTKILLGNEGKDIQPLISHVTDATRLKFGGTRSPQVRRLG